MGIEDLWTTPEGGGNVPRVRVPGVYGYNFTTGLQPYLNALMGRWGQVMDIGTQRLEQQARQDPLAFREWQLGKRSARDIAERQMELSEASFADQQAARERAEREAAAAAYKADMQRRAALNATIDRARNMSSFGYTPFSASGAVADFYEYGPFAPGGRGGGGSAAEGSERQQFPIMGCPPGTRQIGNECVKPEPFSIG